MIWLPLLVAPFVGSVLGVLIVRLPAGRPVALARSECELCRHPLGARDLVPLASFLVLRGRCRFCGGAIAPFHLAVELAALAVAAAGVVADGGVARIWADCGLGWTLLALAWIDAEHFLLPDTLTLPVVVAGLGVTAALDPGDLAGHALGAILGYLGFRAIELGYARLRGRAGLGQGDAKLLAAGGAWAGAAALPEIVFWAALFGIVVALVRARQVGLAARVPFGPALALAILLARLFPATFGGLSFQPMTG